MTGLQLRAVGMDAPEAPQDRVAQPLRFQRAEHDPAVLEDDRMQGHAEVQMADPLDVARRRRP